MNQYFFDFIDGYAAGQSSIRVDAEFLKAAQSCEDAKGQDAPRLLVKSGAAPRVAPSQFRDGDTPRGKTG